MVEKKIIKSTCKSCHGGCGVMVEVQDNVITHIEGNPDSTTKGTMCAKGLSSILRDFLFCPDRIDELEERGPLDIETRGETGHLFGGWLRDLSVGGHSIFPLVKWVHGRHP